jgi:hypothetical protein
MKQIKNTASELLPGIAIGLIMGAGITITVFTIVFKIYGK